MTFNNELNEVDLTASSPKPLIPPPPQDASSYTIKVYFNSEIRRFSFAAVSFPALVEHLKALFSIAREEPVVIQYRDEEDEMITMTTDLELQYAIKLSNGLLHINMKTAENANAPPRAEEVNEWRGRGGNKQHGRRWEARQTMQHPAQRSFGGHSHGPFRAHPLHGGVTPHAVPASFAPPPFAPPFGQAHFAPHFGPPHLEGQPPLALGRGYHGGDWHGHKSLDSNDRSKPVARHVKDVTITDGEEMLPGASFIKTWRVRNEGKEWPAGCVLLYVSRCRGDQMSGPDTVTLEGPVAPNQEVDISVPLVAPTAPGRYTGFWRLSTPDGRKFGQRLWVSVTVLASSSDSEPAVQPPALDPVDEQKIKTIEEMGFGVKRARIERMLRKSGGDVIAVVQKLVKRSVPRTHQNLN